MTKDNIITSHKLIDKIYHNCFDTVEISSNIIDLEITEKRLEEFHKKYYSHLNDSSFWGIESDIREIFIDEREHAFDVGFAAGISLITEVLTIQK